MNDNMSQDKAPLIELTGLWENKDRKGNTYLSGNLSPGVRVLVFKNNYKQNEREPDYRLCLAKRTHDERNDSSAPGGGPSAQSSSSDDAIPF